MNWLTGYEGSKPIRVGDDAYKQKQNDIYQYFKLFRHTLSYANHLGLFSEGIDFESKRLAGNLPQGYSHLALIDAAMTLADMQVTEEQKLISSISDSMTRKQPVVIHRVSPIDIGR